MLKSLLVPVAVATIGFLGAMPAQACHHHHHGCGNSCGYSYGNSCGYSQGYSSYNSCNSCGSSYGGACSSGGCAPATQSAPNETAPPPPNAAPDSSAPAPPAPPQAALPAPSRATVQSPQPYVPTILTSYRTQTWMRR